jgi:hypothetical protein
MQMIPEMTPVHWHGRKSAVKPPERQRASRRETHERVVGFLAGDKPLQERYNRVMAYQTRLRASQYHLTNACNIRCKGCWFFDGGFDKMSREENDLAAIEKFIVRETTDRRINLAVVIGGEPVLFPNRLALYVKHMRHVTIATNGLNKLPLDGFEDVSIGVSVWGGGPQDDELRAIKPGGRRFEGLFETALENYRDDRRPFFVYAITESGIAHIEPTVRKIHENGHPVVFNFYSDYDSESPIAIAAGKDLVDELLRVRALYPDTVISHPYYIETMVTGRSHWGAFGYDTCPSISRDHPAHAARLANGHPVMPLFNTFTADLKSVTFCCTSGRCDGCRNSQALWSWLLVNMHQFTSSLDQVRTWVELSESWWAQSCWSPFHRSKNLQAQKEAA